MLLYIKCQASISLLQLFHSMLLLPPAISPQLVLWLSVVIVPLLSFTLIGNPFNRLITQMAQGKNTGRIVKQVSKTRDVEFTSLHIPAALVRGTLWRGESTRFISGLNYTAVCYISVCPRFALGKHLQEGVKCAYKNCACTFALD
jgi:hypothetical protein